MALTGFALALLAGCTEAPPPPRSAAEVTAVAVATAIQAGGGSDLTISGTVRLKRETPLGFNAGGRIASIGVREGEAVGRGQVLARLDPTSLAAAASSARAEAVRADADYRRLSGLFAQGWVTAPRVETARAAAAAARARVDQAGFDVGLATIRAPASGAVLRRLAEPGQMTIPGQTVLIVGESSSGYVLRVPVAEGDLARIRRGQLASVTLSGLGGAPIAARVSEIGARGDDATGTFRVELSLPPLPGLRSGLIGTARLRLAGGAPTNNAVTVPATAVFSARADEGFVFVHDAGRVRRRLVAIGPLGDADLTVTAGLKAGEQVVVSGVDRLRDGSRVDIVRAGPIVATRPPAPAAG